MTARCRQTETRVAFVGDQYQPTTFGRNEIGARQTDVCFQVLAAQKFARPSRDDLGSVIVGTKTFLLEGAGDFPTVLVQDGLDDVAPPGGVALGKEIAPGGFGGLAAAGV